MIEMIDNTAPIPTHFSLKAKMEWWKNKKSEGDKGGSFNLQLYIDYLSLQDHKPKDQANEKI
jgi:hypothetical protein